MFTRKIIADRYKPQTRTNDGQGANGLPYEHHEKATPGVVDAEMVVVGLACGTAHAVLARSINVLLPEADVAMGVPAYEVRKLRAIRRIEKAPRAWNLDTGDCRE